MRHVKSTVFGVCLAALLFPSAASAQTPQPDAATTFADLALRLPERSSVTVTDRQGRRTRGELTGIAGGTLSITTSARVVTFTQSDVQQVQRHISDSFLNGAFIGLAIGAAAPLIVCTSIGDSSETVGCTVGAFGFGGLPGFAIGALLDRSRTRKVTLFQSVGGRSSAMTISPVIGPRIIGVQASMRLGR